MGDEFDHNGIKFNVTTVEKIKLKKSEKPYSALIKFTSNSIDILLNIFSETPFKTDK